nr:restriction endonuclease subunit S [Gammaproteobacteria bacterium AqS3]
EDGQDIGVDLVAECADGKGYAANCTHALGADLPSRARRRVATQDVLVSSLEGSLSSIALVDSEYDQALCSTGFHVVRSKRLLPEVLFILLRSEIGQKQLERGCNGGIMSSIRQEEFCKAHLPIPPEEVQQKIKETVSHSFMMIRQAGNLIGGSTNIMTSCSAEKNSWEACLTRLGDLK